MTGVYCLIAPRGWTHEDANPFADDGSYGAEWSCFRILEEYDRRMINRRWDNGLYAVVVDRDLRLPNHDLNEILADFLRYETANGRQVILSVPENMSPDSLVQQALRENPEVTVARSSDPKWLVHSTCAENWEGIRACGELRSLARLRREGVIAGGIGFEQFGEPDDYAEHVMLARPGVMPPEFVVASQNAGRIITEPDMPYQPGARLFFDGHRLIREGLIVRDGLHEAKVYDHLPLEPYLIAAISTADLGTNGNITEWTPRIFCNAALERFSELVGEEVPYEHWT